MLHSFIRLFGFCHFQLEAIEDEDKELHSFIRLFGFCHRTAMPTTIIINPIVAFLHSSIRVLPLCFAQRLNSRLSRCIPSFVYSGSATCFLMNKSSCKHSVAFLHSSIRVLPLAEMIRLNGPIEPLHSFIRLFGFCHFIGAEIS